MAIGPHLLHPFEMRLEHVCTPSHTTAVSGLFEFAYPICASLLLATQNHQASILPSTSLADSKASIQLQSPAFKAANIASSREACNWDAVNVANVQELSTFINGGHFKLNLLTKYEFGLRIASMPKQHSEDRLRVAFCSIDVDSNNRSSTAQLNHSLG